MNLQRRSEPARRHRTFPRAEEAQIVDVALPLGECTGGSDASNDFGGDSGLRASQMCSMRIKFLSNCVGCGIFVDFDKFLGWIGAG